MSTCDYGCGTKAKHVMRNGKQCCSSSVNSCAGMRKKNSKAKEGIDPFAGREHPRGFTGKTSWNKGLTAKTCSVIRRAARKAAESLTGRIGFKHTEESKAAISEGMKRIGAGGYREGSGRGKKGMYKGIWCDSSWELAFVLWCEIKNRKVKRARKKFPYRYKGKMRKYLPDFRYLSSDGVWKYVEVKGFMSEQWKAKKEAFPHELLIVGRKTILRRILPKVIETYGENFIELYE